MREKEDKEKDAKEGRQKGSVKQCESGRRDEEEPGKERKVI